MPLTCCFAGDGRPAWSVGGTAADLPGVLDAPGLDCAASSIW